MREPVTGHPSVVFRPVAAPWHAAKVGSREYHGFPFEIDRETRQHPASLGDGDDGVTPFSIEGHEGVRFPIRRYLYFLGDGAVCLEQGIVVFSRKPQGADGGGKRRGFCVVKAGRLIASRYLGLSLPDAQGEFISTQGPRRDICKCR